MRTNDWGGALDLSVLAGRGGASKPAGPAGSRVGGSAQPAATDSSGQTSPFALRITESELAGYLPVSESLPVILELVVEGSAAEAERQQSEQLAALVDSAAGRLLLLRIELGPSSPLVRALQLEQLPALLVLLRQQPIPLTVGVASGQELAMLLNQVLQLAAREGLTGSYPLESGSEAAVPGDAETAGGGEIPLTGHHRSAYEAMLSEDYEAAAEHYRAALRENPGDAEAQAGLAQLALLQRSMTLPESVIGKQPTSPSEALVQADALYLSGEIAEAFKLLLDWFAKSGSEDRESIRARLLELFLIGGDDPTVSEARRKLSQLMF